jgi:hypothetical protein
MTLPRQNFRFGLLSNLAASCGSTKKPLGAMWSPPIGCNLGRRSGIAMTLVVQPLRQQGVASRDGHTCERLEGPRFGRRNGLSDDDGCY